MRQFNVLLDALPNIHMHINQVDPVDQGGPGFYRRLAAEMLTGCTKPLCFQAASADDVLTILSKLNKEYGKTVVMVTHDPHAARFATKVRHLEKGELLAEDAVGQASRPV